MPNPKTPGCGSSAEKKNNQYINVHRKGSFVYQKNRNYSIGVYSGGFLIWAKKEEIKEANLAAVIGHFPPPITSILS